MRTVNYKPKTYPVIFRDMLVDSYTLQLLTNDEHFLEYINNRQDIENNFVLSLSTYALQDSKDYEQMTNIYNSNDIEKAVGTDLDILGDKCGTTRPQATKNSVTLTFSVDEIVDYDITIPQNTIVYDNNGISYYTVSDATIIRGEYETETGALSVNTGGMNMVEPLTLTNCNTLPSNITVTNLQSSSGNHEAYTDDEYRQLLRNWTYSHIKGTQEAYTEFFANYHGLDDYRLMPRWDGAGTLKIIVSPSNDWIINDLYEKLSEETFLLIEDVTITGAETKIVDIKCTINIDIDSATSYGDMDYDQVRELTERAITVYINGGTRRNGTYYQGLGIGEDVIPYQIGLFIHEEIPEIKSVDFRDTIQTIDNVFYPNEFTSASGVRMEGNTLMTDTIGDQYTSDIIYSNNPYMMESDNYGFTIRFFKDGKEIFNTNQKTLLLENMDLYGSYMVLESQKQGARISYIRFLENDNDNDDYNVHICINDDEKAYLGNATVKVQGEETSC